MSDIRDEYERRVGIRQDAGTAGRNWKQAGADRYSANSQAKTREQKAAERELRESVEDLTGKGCDEQTLMAFALMLLYINKDTEKRGVEKLHKRLKRLRERELHHLSKAADCIERINSHPLLGTSGLWEGWRKPLGAAAMCPDDFLSPEQRLQLATIRMFAELPNQIRTYISLIERQIHVVKRVIHRRGNGPGRDSLKYELIQYVRESTGGPNHEKLSCFLVTYASPKGAHSATVDKEFSGQALQQFETRYRQLLH